MFRGIGNWFRKTKTVFGIGVRAHVPMNSIIGICYQKGKKPPHVIGGIVVFLLRNKKTTAKWSLNDKEHTNTSLKHTGIFIYANRQMNFKDIGTEGNTQLFLLRCLYG